MAVYGALQVALLILWSINPEPTTRTSVISATLAFANVILFCMLSYMEHSRSLRPSPLLSIYLIFLILFDAVRVRTLWLVGYDPSIRDLFTASLAMKVLILGMEAKGKRRYFSGADRDLGPKRVVGFLVRASSSGSMP
jgi:ATP-binding cassette, subfamily C (CFTR/MRP), member 1